MEKTAKKENASAAPVGPTRNLGTTAKGLPQHASTIADMCFDLWAGEKASARGVETAGSLWAAVRAHAAGASLLGVLGKCQIPGCDVHILTMDQEIVRHLSVDSATPSGFTAARAYWRAPHDAAIAVLVYSDHADVVMLDGTTMRLTGG